MSKLALLGGEKTIVEETSKARNWQVAESFEEAFTYCLVRQ